MAQELYNADGTTLEYGFDILMSPAEAAMALNVSTATITRWAKTGQLYHRRIRNMRRYPEECVRAAYNNDWERAGKPPTGESAVQLMPQK